MLSPFAPHTAEELWQMLGHPEASRRRPGRRSIRRSPRPTKSSCRCRSTARSARGSRCRPTLSDDELRERALADAAVTSSYRRQDDPEGGGREGSAGQRGGVSDGTRGMAMPCGLFLASCCSVSLLRARAMLSRGCGYSLAGRGSFLPRHIKTIGIPTFANRTHRLQPRNAADAEGPIRVHRPRQVPDRAGRDRTSTRC